MWIYDLSSVDVIFSLLSFCFFQLLTIDDLDTCVMDITFKLFMILTFIHFNTFKNTREWFSRSILWLVIIHYFSDSWQRIFLLYWYIDLELTVNVVLFRKSDRFTCKVVYKKEFDFVSRESNHFLETIHTSPPIPRNNIRPSTTS